MNDLGLKCGEITVREFAESDIEAKVRWINDPENNTYLHYDLPLEYEKTLVWFKNKNQETRLDCVIEFDGNPVGLIGLIDIDKVSNKAEFYICLGDTRFKNKGIAKTATKLLVDYGFCQMHLNKIYLNVDAENEIACRLYEKVGFVCEGYFKRDMLHRGRYIDRKRYAILSDSKLIQGR